MSKVQLQITNIKHTFKFKLAEFHESFSKRIQDHVDISNSKLQEVNYVLKNYGEAGDLTHNKLARLKEACTEKFEFIESVNKRIERRQKDFESEIKETVTRLEKLLIEYIKRQILLCN